MTITIDGAGAALAVALAGYTLGFLTPFGLALVVWARRMKEA